MHLIRINSSPSTSTFYCNMIANSTDEKCLQKFFKTIDELRTYIEESQQQLATIEFLEVGSPQSRCSHPEESRLPSNTLKDLRLLSTSSTSSSEVESEEDLKWR